MQNCFVTFPGCLTPADGDLDCGLALTYIKSNGTFTASIIQQVNRSNFDSWSGYKIYFSLLIIKVKRFQVNNAFDCWCWRIKAPWIDGMAPYLSIASINQKFVRNCKKKNNKKTPHIPLTDGMPFWALHVRKGFQNYFSLCIWN